MIHVDVTKFSRFLDYGGHRIVGRAQGARNKLDIPRLPRGKDYKLRTGTRYFPPVIDDYSCLARIEAHNDETATTAVAVLRGATKRFAEHGVTVERVLLDDGPSYRSGASRNGYTDL